MQEQKGSSMVEFIVSLLVFIPLFIGIPLLGKYADIKHKTIESSRYIAWERTIYSAPGADTTWKDRHISSNGSYRYETSKSDTDILGDAEKRFFGHPQYGLHQTEATSNTFWRNHKGESLLALDASASNNAGSNQILSGGIQQEKASRGLNSATTIGAAGVNAIAQGGGFSGGGIAGGGNFINAVQCGVPGINIGEGLGLGSNGFAKVQATTPVINFLTPKNDDGDPIEDNSLSFKANAAILSNAWTAPSEAEYYHRIDNATPNQFVACATAIGRYTFGVFGIGDGFMYGEGKKSHRVDLAGYDRNRSRMSISRHLPNGLTYYDNDRQ